jgi:uncharacterized protein YqhQ
MSEKKQIAIGGQAVIEGVMMRGPESIATALRRGDGGIEVIRRPFVSITKRNKLLGAPFIRGFVSLIEMTIIGYQTLSISAERAELDLQKPGDKVKSPRRKKIEEGFSFLFALGLAFLLFAFLPYRLAGWIGLGKQNLNFNLVVGLTRVVMFVGYVWAISLLSDVRRLFEFHGAEHCSVHAYEQNKPLTPAVVRTMTTIHPRCGTSFMFFVLLVAILVFTGVDYVVGVKLGRMPGWGLRMVYHILLLPVVSGLSYEILRFSDKRQGNLLVKLAAFPGLSLQKITTRPPDDSQAEVAIVALKAALDMDLSAHENVRFLKDAK